MQDGNTPWKGWQFITGHLAQAHTFTHTFLYRAILSIANAPGMFAGCGKNQEILKETHMDTWKTFEPSTQTQAQDRLKDPGAVRQQQYQMHI